MSKLSDVRIEVKKCPRCNGIGENYDFRLKRVIECRACWGCGLVRMVYTGEHIPKEENKMTDYVKHVYEMIKVDCQGMDAVYEDYILKMVGNHGLEALLENKLLETCGVVNGRQLYAIR